MSKPKIVSREEWMQARLEHLAREKEFSRQRDALSASRREMPWVQVDKTYEFDTPDGKTDLAGLFGSCSQLLVYHFMFHPDWEQGCKSCSFLADSYGGAVPHLAARDVSLVTVSLAPLSVIDPFKQRMGWTFPWVSSCDSEFNRDFHVSFSDEELSAGKAYYNYRESSFPLPEAPGISAFARDEDGAVFHTYSSYGRGLDMFITAYHLLDIVPKGRDEGELPYSMSWIRHHDNYAEGSDDSFH